MTSVRDSTGISDYAMLIYSWAMYAIMCQLINIFGIVTNIINIICFTKQDFNESMNISLLGLSVSDLGSLLTMVWTSLCLFPSFTSADLPFDPVEVAYMTSVMAHFSFTRVSSCITAMITLERCLCIAIPLKIKTIFTTKRTTGTTVCIFIIFFCSGSPVYAVNRLGWKFSPFRNKTLVGILSTADREQVEKITFAINNFCLPSFAFVFIVVCTAILSITLIRKTKWRKKTISQVQDDKVSGRNQKVSKMVLMISTLYIGCCVPVTIIMLAIAFIPDLFFNGRYMKVTMLIAGIGYILESINSSMNFFIYYHMSSKYKYSFRNVFYKEPIIKSVY